MTELETIKDAEYPLIAVLWKGVQCFVKVRELDALQIQAIGNISLINIEKSAPSKDWRTIMSFSELQHKIVKAALVSPTYDQLFELIGKTELAKNAEQTFIEIEKELKGVDKGPYKSMLEQKAQSLRALFDLILPNDFTACITEYALGSRDDKGNVRSQIKLITKDILMECAILQSRCGGRPSDYCPGILTDFNKIDIDRAALILFDKRQKENK